MSYVNMPSLFSLASKTYLKILTLKPTIFAACISLAFTLHTMSESFSYFVWICMMEERVRIVVLLVVCVIESVVNKKKSAILFGSAVVWCGAHAVCRSVPLSYHIAYRQWSKREARPIEKHYFIANIDAINVEHWIYCDYYICTVFHTTYYYYLYDM